LVGRKVKAGKAQEEGKTKEDEGRWRKMKDVEGR
jgi:hypothetical protein